MLIPLQTLIKQLIEDKDLLQGLLSSFVCEKDADIELFLHSKSIEFENISKARTYFLCDQKKLETGEFSILGYFAVSLKVLILPDEMSVRARKEIDGYRGKIHGMPIREIPCFLIGQLAKNSNVNTEEITGKMLLDEAYAVIYSAMSSVGGRYVMIECQDNEKLLKFYKDNGFEEFLREPEGDKPMVQMLRKVSGMEHV